MWGPDHLCVSLAGDFLDDLLVPVGEGLGFLGVGAFLDGVCDVSAAALEVFCGGLPDEHSLRQAVNDLAYGVGEEAEVMSWSCMRGPFSVHESRWGGGVNGL